MVITKNNRIFPIKVEPACLLKWNWSTIYFNSGSTASCHRTKKSIIDPNNVGNFHNTPEKIRDRKMMLDGHWPGHGCEHCRDIEDVGGVSDRQYHLAIQDNPCIHPPELNEDPTALYITPTNIEVYFKNTCNMACVYCGPAYSSRWTEENRKFKSNFTKIKPDDQFDYRLVPDIPHYEQMIKSFWEYLSENNRYLTLRRFHVAGGEPFLLDELDATIDFWDQHKNIDLTFCIISNLNIPHTRFKRIIERFEKLINENKIWKFLITASLDGWGNEQEYTRYGLDLALWEQNFEFLVNKPWVSISINSAVSALTIKTMPVLIKKINYWNSLRGIEYKTPDHVYNEPIIQSFCMTGAFDDPRSFSGDFFDYDFKTTLDLMPEEQDWQKDVKKQLESIFNLIRTSTSNREKVNDLKEYLTALDIRRKTNWQTTFPWLFDLTSYTSQNECSAGRHHEE